jgi:O-antigen ligase
MNSKHKDIVQIGFLSAEWTEKLVALCCTLIFIGFTCSRALVSISMIGLVVVAVFSSNPKTLFGSYFKQSELWVLSLFFWIVFVSGVYSDDKTDWLNWVRIKLPYLFLPFAFAGIKRLSDRTFIAILYAFILTFFISTLFILFRYFSNYHQITESFLRGSALSIPYSHIRYALMLGFSFFCSLYLWQQKQFLFSAGEKYLQIFFAAFTFIALHIISVRSGLLALYLGLFFLACRVVVIEKKWLWGTLVIAAIMVLPFAAYRFVPSLHNKIDYMWYDLGEYKRGEINNKSDAMRIVSIKIGIDIWKENMLLGAGAGDLKNECAKIYERDYPSVSPENRRLPHNQFVWLLATTGTLGLLVFLFVFFYPFVLTGLHKQWLAVVFFLALFSSFFTEHSLEEQMGTGFYLIFLLLLMNRFKYHA